ncbi:MAG: hypothetical protein WA959_19885 [Rivularia sp. (in: cyanobacteria)]
MWYILSDYSVVNNEVEERTFLQTILTMGLEEREEYMEITTSWERKGAQQASL